MKVGVIGLGAMGSRMALNFLQAGHQLFIHNRTKSRGDRLIEKGAQWYDSPKAVAQACEVVMTVLTDDSASKEVWLGHENGLIHGLQGTTIAIECSTISQDWALQLAHHMNGYHYLEAPLVGSRPQVEAKALILLVSGPQKLFQKVDPLCSCTSGRRIWMGDYGKAIALKLGINALLGIQTAAFAEIYSLLIKAGLKKETVTEALVDLPVTSPVMRKMLALFTAEQFAPLFPVHLLKKDLSYAQDLAQSKQAMSYTLKNTDELFKKAMKEGLGEQNISGILNLMKPTQNTNQE